MMKHRCHSQSPPGDLSTQRWLGTAQSGSPGLLGWITSLFLEQPVLPSAFRKPEQPRVHTPGRKKANLTYLTHSLPKPGPWLCKASFALHTLSFMKPCSLSERGHSASSSSNEVLGPCFCAPSQGENPPTGQFPTEIPAART